MAYLAEDIEEDLEVKGRQKYEHDKAEMVAFAKTKKGYRLVNKSITTVASTEKRDDSSI